MIEQAPTKIMLNKDKNELTLIFVDNDYKLSAEFLRVYSPSAEVKGHHPSQQVLEFGKKNVIISKIRAVGNYAIAITFSDGHSSGIYSWQYLKFISKNYDDLWLSYIDKLKEASLSRESIKITEIK